MAVLLGRCTFSWLLMSGSCFIWYLMRPTLIWRINRPESSLRWMFHENLFFQFSFLFNNLLFHYLLCFLFQYLFYLFVGWYSAKQKFWTTVGVSFSSFCTVYYLVTRVPFTWLPFVISLSFVEPIIINKQ